jgi:hypothetical protein
MVGATGFNSLLSFKMTVMLSTTENVEQGFGIIKLDITASLLSKKEDKEELFVLQ